MRGITKYEQTFYDQFSKFQIDVRKLVEAKRESNELLERQNEILVGIYSRLVPAKPEEPPTEPPKPITGNSQIDAALRKQKENL